MAKKLLFFSLIILTLLLLSYLIPESAINANPALVYTLYYAIPVILLISGLFLVKKLERHGLPTKQDNNNSKDGETGETKHP